MTRAAVLLVVSLAVAAGCDLSVENGEVTELANRGQVFGAATPNAVRVRPGGTLVVRDADLFGRGRVVDALPAGLPTPGAAIVADAATVRIVKGQIVGGNVLVTVDPNSFPVPVPVDGAASAKAFASVAGVIDAPPSARAFATVVGVPLESGVVLPPALSALHSSVVIEGGTLIGSSAFGAPQPFFAATAPLQVIGGQLLITGGEFLPGTMIPPPLLRFPVRSLFALQTDVEIRGGNFDAAPVSLTSSRARITGGRFGAGLFVGSLVSIELVQASIVLPPPPCYEVRGGSFSSIAVNGPDPLFIFGTGFNLPLGPVPTGATPLALTGLFPNGAPIDLDLTAFPGTQVFLAAPGAPGCGPTLVAIPN